MSETQKTILIAGGVVVGAFVLMKFLAPPPVRTGAPSSTSSLSGLIGNIASIGGAVAGIFGKGGGSGEPSISGGHYDFGAAEQANIDAYNAQPGTQYGIAGIDYSF